jgi:hypothetical protein
MQSPVGHCLRIALSFLWLHEIAHVHLGHIDFCLERWPLVFGKGRVDLAAAEPADEEYDESSCDPIPFHALEIEADTWAVLKLFGRTHKSIPPGSKDDFLLVSTAIGCTLVPLLFYSRNMLHGRMDRAARHPPLWFRADEVIRSEKEAAGILWGESGECYPAPREEYEARRGRQEHSVARGIAAIIRVHPEYGNWLGPVLDPCREVEADRVLD